MRKNCFSKKQFDPPPPHFCYPPPPGIDFFLKNVGNSIKREENMKRKKNINIVLLIFQKFLKN